MVFMVLLTYIYGIIYLHLWYNLPTFMVEFTYIYGIIYLHLWYIYLHLW